MGGPVIGVLALQGDVREHVSALAGVGADARAVRRPAELDAVDGLVIPGGESTTMSRLVDIFGLRAPIDERIAAGMPVYGSCAGMIMLATEVLDGRPDQRGFAGIAMTVRRNAFGRQVDSFEAPVEITGIDGGPFHAVFIRAPWVERVDADVEVLGRVTGGPAVDRIVAVRRGNLVATSFHPELTGDLRLHRYFADLVGAAR
ncbi:pyridoxal 5'-phosphate synthase glutaminase subunit PdxT [Micromonospora sp. RL09-050-HVF-A]|uniref:pyridoxal 5'-phosphate synthase glutaminase subunit PdxT n=1 Tax=unclassified Micromonospora TaxID=2617518 RepID=UPI001C5CF73C|nr:pyridoxal 5'-phosphate synthase glutaminase subunit PdxT [Micromonospora sp. RL09-050-HVF-A]MBW4706021.1 pyridoxal 5'-phosphate synthase glutaminase subunit PdxT [Micromonospora sp. RL09-050-HVF-A]